MKHNTPKLTQAPESVKEKQPVEEIKEQKEIIIDRSSTECALKSIPRKFVIDVEEISKSADKNKNAPGEYLIFVSELFY